jgi:hypothetical protein
MPNENDMYYNENGFWLSVAADLSAECHVKH